MIFCSSPSFAGIHFHHIFPQQFSSYFTQHGINPHLYTVPLDEQTHRKLHSKEFRYNPRWMEFIKAHPDTDEESIFGYAAILLAEAKIKGSFDFHDYNSKKKTGKSLRVKSAARKALKKFGINSAAKVISKQAAKIIAKRTAMQLIKIIPGVGAVVAAGEVVYLISESVPDEINEIICGEEKSTFKMLWDVLTFNPALTTVPTVGDSLRNIGSAHCFIQSIDN
jgi:hypothetical protein